MDKAVKAARSRVGPGEPTKSELTRQRFLDAAAKVFATRGYAHTRLSDVAREANAHAGGIYYYFASREVLVSEVLDIATLRSIEKLNAALDALPSTTNARDRLLAAAIALLEGIMAQDFFNLAHNRIHAQVPEEVRERHRPLLHRFFSIWRDIVTEGQKRGEIRDDVDPTILRLTIVGSIQWATEWAQSANSSAEVLATKMMQIFFGGILPNGQNTYQSAADRTLADEEAAIHDQRVPRNVGRRRRSQK